MSERNVLLLLTDMKSSLSKILHYTEGYHYKNYIEDDRTREAVERNFQIIGEAASRIPIDFKSLHVDIEWRIIKDFRNFLIHEYFGIDNQIIWQTIQNQLPALLKKIDSLIQQMPNEQ